MLCGYFYDCRIRIDAIETYPADGSGVAQPPFVVIGIGIIGAPMYFLSSQTMPPEGYKVLAFWMMGIGATALTAMYTRDISLWRRLPYIYLIMTIISGTPILLSSNFGQ